MLGYLPPTFKHMYINVCACLVSIVAEFLIAVDDQYRIMILPIMLVLAESGTEPVFFQLAEPKSIDLSTTS